MKKFFVAVIAVAMMLSLTVVPALATGDMHATFSVGEYTADPGDTLEVAVNLDGNYEYHGLTMELNYDSTYLTATGMTVNNAMFPGFMTIPDYETYPGSVRFGIMGASNAGLTQTGDLFTVTFTVSEEVEPGTVIPLELVVSSFVYMPISDPEVEIERDLVNGSVTINGEVATPEPTTPPEVTPEPTEPGDTTAPEVTPDPGDQPTPPPTGTIALVGVGIAAVAAGAGIILFRKKEN